jgi:transposase-like protein
VINPRTCPGSLTQPTPLGPKRFEMCPSKNALAAREIERKYDLTPKSASFMTHRIPEAMKREPLTGLLGGPVQVDETWIGDDPKNLHGGDTRKRPGTGYTDKQPVVSLIHYESREVHSVVVPDVTGKTLMPAIEKVMDPKRTWLYTDSAAAYRSIAPHVCTGSIRRRRYTPSWR